MSYICFNFVLDIYTDVLDIYTVNIGYLHCRHRNRP